MKNRGERPAGGSPLSLRRLGSGAGLFLLLTLGGTSFVALRAGNSKADLWALLRTAHPWPLALAVLLALLEIGLAASRLWVAARHVHPGFRWRQGLQAQLYNLVGSGLTPLQAGGAPAQYYMLRRAGLDGSRTVAVLTATWVGVMGGLLAFGVLSGFYLVRDSEVISVAGTFRGMLITLLVLTGGAALFLLSPRRLERLLLTGPRRDIPRARRRAVRAVARYRRAIGSFMSAGGRRAWAANAGLSTLMLLARGLAGVAVLHALGVNANAISALARQTLQFALIYVSPSPGGSGVAELSSLGLMAGLVPAALLTGYTILWRMATAYVGIALGGCFLAYELLRGRLGALPS
ncbi:MAG: YbhN family protein [Gemmatimonadota bacterium]